MKTEKEPVFVYTPALTVVCGCQIFDDGTRLVINLCLPHRSEGNAARLVTEALGTVTR